MREKLRLRLAIDGPSGSGKTVTVNRLAKALGPRVALIDTESGSARKYAGEDFGEGPIEFDVIELTTFAPTEYTVAIEEAGRAGYDTLIIDSLSHAWEGKEGVLELVDKRGGNRFVAWREITPTHRRMIEAILTSPCHVLCTMRSKTEYVVDTDERGRAVPHKIGTGPVQRAGMEYEFDIYGSMNWSHILTITKSRCRTVDGAIVARPGAEWMAPVVAWLERGTAATITPPKPTIRDDQVERVTTLLQSLCWPLDRVARDFPRKFGCSHLHELHQDQADQLLVWLEAQLKARVPAVKPAPAEAAKTNGHPAPPPPPADDAPKASAAQLDLLKKHRDELFARAGLNTQEAVKDQWQKILAKHGVVTARDLTPDQVAKLISNLAHQLNSLDLAGGTSDPAECESMRAAAATPPPGEGKEVTPAGATKSGQ
jgi:hypothetical protein